MRNDFHNAKNVDRPNPIIGSKMIVINTQASELTPENPSLMKLYKVPNTIFAINIMIDNAMTVPTTRLSR